MSEKNVKSFLWQELDKCESDCQFIEFASSLKHAWLHQYPLEHDKWDMFVEVMGYKLGELEEEYERVFSQFSDLNDIWWKVNCAMEEGA